MKTKIQKFINDESGATAIEYGLLAALIAIVMAAGATTLGKNLNDMFTFIAGKFPKA